VLRHLVAPPSRRLLAGWKPALHRNCQLIFSPKIVVVFAKLARPGKVKTRLRARLTAQQAAAVHLACVRDTVAMVPALPRCGKYLLVAGGHNAAREFAKAIGLRPSWRVGAQRGRNLGQRLRSAFQSFFRQGARQVVVVGTDTPWMGAARVARAFELLGLADVVLGPTEDGGYYLVGAQKLVPAMFHGIPWGTSAVFRRTLSALRRSRATWRLLPRDFDLDRPSDLARAARLLEQGKVRAEVLRRWLRRWEKKLAP